MTNQILAYTLMVLGLMIMTHVVYGVFPFLHADFNANNAGYILALIAMTSGRTFLLEDKIEKIEKTLPEGGSAR